MKCATDRTIHENYFQKFSGEGLTEPPPQTPPPFFLGLRPWFGLRPQFLGTSRPCLSTKNISQWLKRFCAPSNGKVWICPCLLLTFLSSLLLIFFSLHLHYSHLFCSYSSLSTYIPLISSAHILLSPFTFLSSLLLIFFSPLYLHSSHLFCSYSSLSTYIPLISSAHILLSPLTFLSSLLLIFFSLHLHSSQLFCSYSSLSTYISLSSSAHILLSPLTFLSSLLLIFFSLHLHSSHLFCSYSSLSTDIPLISSAHILLCPLTLLLPWICPCSGHIALEDCNVDSWNWNLGQIIWINSFQVIGYAQHESSSFLRFHCFHSK